MGSEWPAGRASTTSRIAKPQTIQIGLRVLVCDAATTTPTIR